MRNRFLIKISEAMSEVPDKNASKHRSRLAWSEIFSFLYFVVVSEVFDLRVDSEFGAKRRS